MIIGQINMQPIRSCLYINPILLQHQNHDDDTQKNTQPKNAPDFNYIKIMSSVAFFDCRVEYC